MTIHTKASNRTKDKEEILKQEIMQMLHNPNPLTGIYSIYGDYPIEDDERERPIFKKLEAMNVAR